MYLCICSAAGGDHPGVVGGYAGRVQGGLLGRLPQPRHHLHPHCSNDPGPRRQPPLPHQHREDHRDQAEEPAIPLHATASGMDASGVYCVPFGRIGPERSTKIVMYIFYDIFGEKILQKLNSLLSEIYSS